MTPVPGTYEISTGTARIEADRINPGGFQLYVNGVPSSYIIPGAPLELEFEYMVWIVEAVASVVASPERVRITHLGGAGCSLPRHFAARWPRSRNTVVELDAGLAQLVREQFDIPRSPTVKIRVGEARAVTDGLYPASREVIIRDVFAEAVTPRPLTTVEFYQAAHRALVPGGLYAANCGSHADLREAKEELAGMLEVFEQVAVIADPSMLKGRRYGNVVLLGSDGPLVADPQLTRTLLRGAVPAQYKETGWVRTFASGRHPRHDA